MDRIIELFMDGMAIYHALFGLSILLWAIAKGKAQPGRRAAHQKDKSFVFTLGIFFFGLLCGISWLIGILQKMGNTGRF